MWYMYWEVLCLVYHNAWAIIVVATCDYVAWSDHVSGRCCACSCVNKQVCLHVLSLYITLHVCDSSYMHNMKYVLLHTWSVLTCVHYLTCVCPHLFPPTNIHTWSVHACPVLPVQVCIDVYLLSQCTHMQEWQLKLSGIDVAAEDDDSDPPRSPVGAINPLLLQEGGMSCICSCSLGPPYTHRRGCLAHGFEVIDA